ncbi:MAG: SlyX family protein [Pseudomonadota bacterium]
MTDPMERLESKIAFFDEELSQLRDAVDIQQQQILSLEGQCESLRLRLADALSGDNNAAADDNTPPPHY